MKKIKEAMMNSRGEISANSLVKEIKPTQMEGRPPVQKSGTAAVLSFFIPGLGQIFTGRFIAAIFWFILVPIGLALFILPGILFHCLNIKDAYDRGA
jgi:TM2 domain-containing membrane protein YozV